MAAVAHTAARYGTAGLDPARRGATLALVAVVHLLLAWLLLSASPTAVPDVAATALNLFEVALPPPPEPPAQPPPVRANMPPAAGGSSGRALRPSPAPREPGRAASIDATLVAEMPPAPVDLIDLGTVAAGDGSGGGGSGLASGTGSGRGVGAGDGIGPGSGSGTDGLGQWAKVDWIEQPRPDQWRTVWPVRALYRKEGGVAILVCIVPRPGTPRNCFIADEHPAGRGFGRAALALSKLDTFRIRPVRTPGGRWSRIPIRVPVIFVAGRGPMAATSGAAAPPAPPRP